MQSSHEKHSGWLLIIGIVVGVLALTAGPALAALNFSGTGITGDSSGVGIDTPGTISIGTSTATGITIGNENSTTTFNGNVEIGNTALTSVNTDQQQAASYFDASKATSPTGAEALLGGIDTPVGSTFSYSNYLDGLYGQAYNQGTGNLAHLFGAYLDAENLGGGTVGQLVSSYQYLNAASSSPVTSGYGNWIDVDGAGLSYTDLYGVVFSPPGSGDGPGPFATNEFAYWSDDLAGTATNPYFYWFDSQGVGRCKDDSSFNGVDQSICVVYNPQFTKYTPGAANFERIVYGEWNSNVAEMGPEAGGTGTLQPLDLMGSKVGVSLAGAAPSTTFQVAGASSTIRIGTSALPGCLEMGNSDGSGGINYITVLNGALTATTTKPSACQ